MALSMPEGAPKFEVTVPDEYWPCGINGCILQEHHCGCCIFPFIERGPRRRAAVEEETNAPEPASEPAPAPKPKPKRKTDTPQQSLRRPSKRPASPPPPPAADGVNDDERGAPKRRTMRTTVPVDRLGSGDGWATSSPRAWVSPKERVAVRLRMRGVASGMVLGVASDHAPKARRGVPLRPEARAPGGAAARGAPAVAKSASIDDDLDAAEVLMRISSHASLPAMTGASGNSSGHASEVPSAPPSPLTAPAGNSVCATPAPPAGDSPPHATTPARTAGAAGAATREVAAAHVAAPLSFDEQLMRMAREAASGEATSDALEDVLMAPKEPPTAPKDVQSLPPKDAPTLPPELTEATRTISGGSGSSSTTAVAAVAAHRVVLATAVQGVLAPPPPVAH